MIETTFGKVCGQTREIIKQSLNGKACCWDESGELRIWGTNKEEASENALALFDSIIETALNEIARGRTIEKLYLERAPDPNEYEKVLETEKQKLGIPDYKNATEGKNPIRIIGWDNLQF